MRDVRERTRAPSATMIGPSVHGVLPQVGKGVIRRAVGASVPVGCFSVADSSPESPLLPLPPSILNCGDSMTEERKRAILPFGSAQLNPSRLRVNERGEKERRGEKQIPRCGRDNRRSGGGN